MSRARFERVVRVAGALVVLAAVGLALAQAEEPVSARAFEVRFRPLTDAADLVEPLLSNDGKLTLRPRLTTLVVEDRPAVLARVAELLRGWDQPPPNVEITLSLFLGSDSRREDPGAPRQDHGLSREVRGVLEKLSDFTKWTTYEPLGSRSVTGTAGDTVVANLSDAYRVVLVVESVSETHGAVKFERLQLQEVTHAKDGSESVRDLYTAALVLPAGKLRLVGAATDPNSNRALFLALQTRPR